MGLTLARPATAALAAMFAFGSSCTLPLLRSPIVLRDYTRVDPPPLQEVFPAPTETAAGLPAPFDGYCLTPEAWKASKDAYRAAATATSACYDLLGETYVACYAEDEKKIDALVTCRKQRDEARALVVACTAGSAAGAGVAIGVGVGSR